MIKMIVCDMDGTLLNQKKQMPDKMGQMILELHEEGIIFVAASGRQYYSLTHLFSKLKDKMIFIADNGCMIVHGARDEIIGMHEIDKQAVKEFIQIARTIPDTYLVLSGAEKAYYDSEKEEVYRNVTPYYHRHQYVKDLLEVDEPIIKMAILNLKGTQNHVFPFFEQYQKDYNIAVSAFEWMDIMPLHIHKGSAVSELQKRLNITEKETMAFGDFMNDHEMLQQAYFSFAMKNAVDEIKNIARFKTTYSNDEEGVLREIEEWKKDNWKKIKEYE